MLNVYFTFDYELFVNDNTGDIDHCLIIPTNELLNMLERYSVHVTFFIDMAYAYRLNELIKDYPVLESDFIKFCNQVKNIKERGHEIALHLHPQWFYAKYDGNKWVMDFDHYKLSDMPEKDADEKFDACCNLLRTISDFDVKTFRAGGFSIQDYKGFYHALKRNGIINDSSVLFGEKQITRLHNYDYTSLSNAEVYNFDVNLLQPATDGFYKEFPISTQRMSLLRYVLYKLHWNYTSGPEYLKWGNGGDTAERRNEEFKANIKRRIKDGVRVTASVDGHFGLLLPIFYKEYKRKGYKSIVVLGHPKLASKASINNIESFIVNYLDKVTFKTI